MSWPQPQMERQEVKGRSKTCSEKRTTEIKNKNLTIRTASRKADLALFSGRSGEVDEKA